jgi:hypothetical protein
VVVNSALSLSGEASNPNAQSLICRFDANSSTSFEHGLSLEYEGGEEMLQGNFGNCSVQIPANTVRYRFPVAQTMNWCLSAEHKGKDIRLSQEAMSAQMRKDKVGVF